MVGRFREVLLHTYIYITYIYIKLIAMTYQFEVTYYKWLTLEIFVVEHAGH